MNRDSEKEKRETELDGEKGIKILIERDIEIEIERQKDVEIEEQKELVQARLG